MTVQKIFLFVEKPHQTFIIFQTNGPCSKRRNQMKKVFPAWRPPYQYLSYCLDKKIVYVLGGKKVSP